MENTEYLKFPTLSFLKKDVSIELKFTESNAKKYLTKCCSEIDLFKSTFLEQIDKLQMKEIDLTDPFYSALIKILWSKLVILLILMKLEGQSPEEFVKYLDKISEDGFESC